MVDLKDAQRPRPRRSTPRKTVEPSADDDILIDAAFDRLLKPVLAIARPKDHVGAHPAARQPRLNCSIAAGKTRKLRNEFGRHELFGPVIVYQRRWAFARM